MPELPEAETIVRGIRAPLVGRRITNVEILRPDLVVGAGSDFRAGAEGRRFEEVGRRGKNLVLEIRAGSGRPARMIVNLGMSGRLLHRAADRSDPPPSHPGVRFHLDDGSVLIYHDPRRFGRLRILDPVAFGEWSRSLGPEPLAPSFTARRMSTALSRSSAPARSWLLDQRKVAGIGNIYANEALFRAGIHPRAPGRDLTAEEGRRLHRSVRGVLREAIRARGTTVRDYRTADGMQGSYAAHLRVYGREGQPCPRCAAPVERLMFGGRSAFLCPRCQPWMGR